jgi:hypothetical protein
MAEIKNSFLKAKMNQDLDDRLIPSGEYREALNISVGKSENSDVGTLQNILGNTFVAGNNEYVPGTTTLNPDYIPGLECIGYFMDNINNRIYQFLTNDGDNGVSPIVHQITVYDFVSLTYTILVKGAFLNFSKSSPVTAVNLVENLLFWTDYNNQPRKINVNLANPNFLATPTYYTTEEQISVAKYAPVDPISLVRKVSTKTTAAVAGSDIIPVASITGIVIGMTAIADNNNTLSSGSFVLVESIGTNSVTVSSPVNVASGVTITFLISTMSDQSSNKEWPGDPAFLKSKYVRFSYRFKLDDGEYTLMAPFTQIAYIPNQKGYFIEGNENDAYQSTVLKWFENNINNIRLLIPFPDVLSKVNQSYKIQALDILYKESDSTTIKVIETIPYSAFSTNTVNNIYEYDYQSRKPYKTLPEDQTTRVYDMVPVKAKAQEIAGNRVIYGNFLKNHTAPINLDYQVSVSRKRDNSVNFIEYPNHTLKQNRTYQVGFILSDKYGRQSSVILSSLDTKTTTSEGITYGGSTIFSPYYSSGDVIGDFVKEWFGNALVVLVNSPITSTIPSTNGEPGLYAIPTSTTGFTLQNPSTTTITDTSYTFTISAGVSPAVGDFLRGQYTDYVEVLTKTPNPLLYGVTCTITTSGRVNDIYARNTQNDPKDIKYAYNINALGWYSYKIVVRQQEQDYYNVYLPGMLNGYPKGQTYGSELRYSAGNPYTANGINTTIFPTTETNKVAHTVLINDNINKVPRDLVEVGPDQKLYRSSVQLFGRVENTILAPISSAPNPNNRQYFPSKKADTAIAIASSMDLGFLPKTVENEKGSATYNFYQLETQPSIARISTTNSIGVVAYENTGLANNPPDTDSMAPYLSVYETKPIFSLLDVFWETSTTGLISDLNADVLVGYEGAVGLSDVNWDFTEAKNNGTPNSEYITNFFQPVSNTGTNINSTFINLEVRDGYNNIVNYFDIYQQPFNVGLPTEYRAYRIYFKPGSNLAFISDPKLITFQFKITLLPLSPVGAAPIEFIESRQLENVTPTITVPATPTLSIDLSSPVPPGSPIHTFSAVNGSAGSALNKNELLWDIVNAAPTTPGWQSYFQINTIANKDGELELINTLPLSPQFFTLKVRVRDAMSANGAPTNSINGTDYSTKEDFCIVTVGVVQTNICGRDWTTTNYTGTTYTDGTTIPQVTDPNAWAALTTGAWCYYNNDQANEIPYGKLYNSYAIQGIWNSLNPNDRKEFAPPGWRVPYENELCVLSCVDGGDLKETGTTHWDFPNTGATNSLVPPFNGVGGGYRGPDGFTFNRLKEHSVFHARKGGTVLGPATWGLNFNNTTLVDDTGIALNPKAGYSVRFTKDDFTNYEATLPLGSSFCSVTFANQNGIIDTILLDENNPGPTPFRTIAPCSITGSCTWTPTP